MNSRSGQTIIELLVALTLIILFLAGVIVVQLFALRNVQYSQKKSEATKLASQQLERARVIRDSVGIDQLASCSDSCFINSELTPVPITPTGTFGQTMQIVQATSVDCPAPAISITPVPIVYRATVRIEWSQGTPITPAPEVILSSCITDWR